MRRPTAGLATVFRVVLLLLCSRSNQPIVWENQHRLQQTQLDMKWWHRTWSDGQIHIRPYSLHRVYVVTRRLTSHMVQQQPPNYYSSLSIKPSLSAASSSPQQVLFFTRLRLQTCKRSNTQKVWVLRLRILETSELSAMSDNMSFTGGIMKGRKDRAMQGESWWSQFGGKRWKVDFFSPEKRRKHRTPDTHSAFVFFLPGKIGRTLVRPGFIMGISSMLLCCMSVDTQQLIDVWHHLLFWTSTFSSVFFFFLRFWNYTLIE